MTRKELKAQEKENVGYIKKENKISTSIDRDGSRTTEAKERSCAKAKLKREKNLVAKIADRRVYGEKEAHLKGLGNSRMKWLENNAQSRERI